MQEAVPAPGKADLASYFANKLVGQPNAAARIIPFIQTYRAGLNHVNRPVGIFLLLGPTGTGKTRTVEVLAEALHGNPQHYVRIDCGEFQLDHEVAKLIGAPPGYIGHRESVPVLSNSKLAAALSPDCDLSLVLFDEIEKAAPSLGQLLLGILDKGRLTLGDGSVVSFENSLIFLTSNLGAREMMNEMAPAFGFETVTKSQIQQPDIAEKLEAIAMTAVRKRFSPEFVNRIDVVITYQPLSAESIAHILNHQIEELKEHLHTRLGPRGFSIELVPSACEFLLSHGVSVNYGARELKRVLYRYLTQPLATLVAENVIAPGSCVTISSNASGGKLDFNTQDAVSKLQRPSKLSVLLVDDNESLLKFMKLVLSSDGWNLSAAATAGEALQLAERTKFHLAVIDYMLPDMDGASLSMKLRAKLPNLRIVMMTGGGEMSFSQQSDFADVPVIQKPFIVEDLLQVLRSRLPKDGKEESATATST